MNSIEYTRTETQTHTLTVIENFAIKIIKLPIQRTYTKLHYPIAN